MFTRTYDVAIVGGGIVGLATAKALTEASVRSLVVVEAERELARHQTGHNSGVIHAGLYYKPGSLKAQNCVNGREQLYQFCEQHGIPHERCGKIVVAVHDSELPALEELQRRGAANGLDGIRRLNGAQLTEFEPHVQGVAGIHVPQTGIINYRDVAQRLAELIRQASGHVHTHCRFIGIRHHIDSLVLETSAGPIQSRNLIACAGLYADRIARKCGLDPGIQVVPFRGEYYELVPQRSYLVKNLIYPVPNPQFPFLGVHFSRTIEGSVEAGPNAVLAFKREGYRRSDFSLRDVSELFRYRGFWRMARKHAGMGLAEMRRSFSKRAFVRALQNLVPEVQIDDVRRAGAGVRAQALEPDGRLVDDFRIVGADRMIHVLNAPSPAATACLSIGQTLAAMAVDRFQLRRA